MDVLLLDMLNSDEDRAVACLCLNQAQIVFNRRYGLETSARGIRRTESLAYGSRGLVTTDSTPLPPSVLWLKMAWVSPSPGDGKLDGWRNTTNDMIFLPEFKTLFLPRYRYGPATIGDPVESAVTRHTRPWTRQYGLPLHPISRNAVLQGMALSDLLTLWKAC